MRQKEIVLSGCGFESSCSHITGRVEYAGRELALKRNRKSFFFTAKNSLSDGIDKTWVTFGMRHFHISAAENLISKYM